jgi:hypothetical protein
MKGGTIKFDPATRIFFIEQKNLSKKDPVALQYNRLEADLFNLLELVCRENRIPLGIKMTSKGFADTHDVYDNTENWWNDVYSCMSYGQKKTFIYLLETTIKKRVESFFVGKHLVAEGHFQAVLKRNNLLNKFSTAVNDEPMQHYYQVHGYNKGLIANNSTLSPLQLGMKATYLSQQTAFDALVGRNNIMMNKGVKHGTQVDRDETGFFIKYFKEYYDEEKTVDTYSIYCNTSIINTVVDSLNDEEKRLFLMRLIDITNAKKEYARQHPLNPTDKPEIQNIALHIEVRTNALFMFLDYYDMSGIQGDTLIEEYEMSVYPPGPSIVGTVLAPIRLPGLSITPLTNAQHMIKHDLTGLLVEKNVKSDLNPKPVNLNHLFEEDHEPHKPPSPLPQSKPPSPLPQSKPSRKKLHDKKTLKLQKKADDDYLKEAIALAAKEANTLEKVDRMETRSQKAKKKVTKNGNRKTRKRKRLN